MKKRLDRKEVKKEKSTASGDNYGTVARKWSKNELVEVEGKVDNTNSIRMSNKLIKSKSIKIDIHDMETLVDTSSNNNTETNEQPQDQTPTREEKANAPEIKRIERNTSTPVNEMNKKELTEWAKQNNLDFFTDKISELDIDGEVFVNLTPEEMKNIGLSFGQIKKLNIALEKLKR